MIRSAADGYHESAASNRDLTHEHSQAHTRVKPRAIERFHFDDSLDLGIIAPVFRETGRVLIPRFLDTIDAEALYSEISNSVQWTRVVHSNGLTMDLPHPSNPTAAWLDARSAHDAAYSSARFGTGYIYEQGPFPTTAQDGSEVFPLLAAFVAWLGTSELLDAFRNLTGIADLVHVVANATRDFSLRTPRLTAMSYSSGSEPISRS